MPKTGNPNSLHFSAVQDEEMMIRKKSAFHFFSFSFIAQASAADVSIFSYSLFAKVKASHNGFFATVSNGSFYISHPKTFLQCLVFCVQVFIFFFFSPNAGNDSSRAHRLISFWPWRCNKSECGILTREGRKGKEEMVFGIPFRHH